MTEPHEPLLVRAHLQCGVIADRFLPLDGVLWALACREAAGGPPAATVPGANVGDGVHPTLPLRRIRPSADTSFYACSFAVWPADTVEGTSAWVKRADWSACDLVDFDGRRGKIETGAGRYKSAHMPVYYRHARTVEWYARGRADEIRRLLAHCFWLGKKREMGWGAVLRWDVDLTDRDWSVRDDSGRAMRAIPRDNGPHVYGVKPPYWSPRHQRRCVLPEAR